MIGWCIVIVSVVFSLGFITSAWFSSKKIVELEDENHRLGMKLIEAYNELEELKKCKGSYPVYDVKG